MAAKIKYNPDYHDDWAWSLAAMGATNDEIANAMGVSKRTIIRWGKAHKSFGEALASGKGVSDAKVIRSLYQRAVGYEYEEEKRIIEYDKEGNIKPVRIEKTKKRVLPDVGAQCFWLKNRQRAFWKDSPDYAENKRLEIEQRRKEFEYKKEKDAGITMEIEDLDDIESEIYENQKEDDQKGISQEAKNDTI